MKWPSLICGRRGGFCACWKLQRVLRISGTRNICVDVRIIAATNANLWERVKRNQFRADLFYRLSVLVGFFCRPCVSGRVM